MNMLKGVAFDRLVGQILPDLLAEIGCAESGRGIKMVLADSGGTEDELVDALDNASADALDNGATSEGDAADRSERVGVLARHLAQLLSYEVAAPTRSAKHLGRAIEIAAQLGRGVGPLGAVA